MPPWSSWTRARNAGSSTERDAERTTTSSVSRSGPRSRCSIRSWARTLSGRPVKPAWVVSASSRNAEEAATAATISTAHSASVRHGWRLAARARASGRSLDPMCVASRSPDVHLHRMLTA